MEFIIAAAIILILLLILGVSPMTIMFGILWLMEAALAGMSVFFLICIVLILAGRRCKATFLRFSDAKFPAAVYEIEGEEITNLYPAENHFRKLIYKNSPRQVRLLRWKKMHFLFDGHSILIAALGLPLSVCGMLGLGLLLFMTV